MRPEKKESSGKERWLVSYADLMTLLFAFFTTLYAISSIDQKKAAQLSGAMQDAFHTLAPEGAGVLPDQPGVMPAASAPVASVDERQALAKELRRFAEVRLAQKVEIREEPRGVVVSLAEGAFFTSGSAQLRPGAQELLDALADELKPKNLNLLVEGHTDDVPVRGGRYPSNWELFTARATAVVVFFVERHHFAPQRLSAAGYGPYRPIADNQLSDGRAKNRRVDLVLQPSLVALRAPDPPKKETP